MQIRKVIKYNPENQELLVETETISVEQVSSLHHWGWDHFKQCPIYADASTPQPKDKFDKNLNHKRKTNFESELAKSVF